jgi:hypothetical protein
MKCCEYCPSLLVHGNITTVKSFIVQDPPGQTANMPDEEEEKRYQSSSFSCETIDLKEYT